MVVVFAIDTSVSAVVVLEPGIVDSFHTLLQQPERERAHFPAYCEQETELYRESRMDNMAAVYWPDTRVVA